MKANYLLIFTILVFFGAAGVFGQSACGSRETIKAKTPKQAMDIRLEKFNFSVPAELEDLTIYTFGAEDGKVTLKVFYSQAEAGVRDSKSSIADFRAELESVMGKAVRVESEKDTEIVRLPARQIQYTVAREDGKLTRWVTADAYNKSNNHIIRIIYVMENGGEAEIAAKFEKLRSSAALSETPSNKPTPGGYKRQFAGRITLDVEEMLQPPQKFSFGDVSGKNQPYLELIFYLESDNPPDFEQEKADDEESLGKLNGEVSSTAVKTETVEGTRYSYSLLEKPYPNVTKKFAVRRAHLKLSGGIEVHLFGWSDAGIESELNSHWTSVLNSLASSEVKK